MSTRLGLAVIPRRPQQLGDAAAWAEDVGFDVLWLGDTLGDWIDPGAPFLDAWPALGGLARTTQRIELGVLVANLSWRSPIEVARWAMTLDQLSDGRFQLGLGCGYVDDQRMAGPDVVEMAAGERVERLTEGLVVVDRLLNGDTSAFDGRFTTYSGAAIAPGPVQQPRPPLTVAGVGPRVMRIAAQHADVWNTFVDTATMAEYEPVAAERLARLDAICECEGRDPASLRRSLTVYFEAVDAWADDTTLPAIVDTYTRLGFSEFVLYPPRQDQLDAAARLVTRLVRNR